MDCALELTLVLARPRLLAHGFVLAPDLAPVDLVPANEKAFNRRENDATGSLAHQGASALHRFDRMRLRLVKAAAPGGQDREIATSAAISHILTAVPGKALICPIN